MSKSETIELDNEEGFQEFKIGDTSIKIDVFKAFQDLQKNIKDKQAFPGEEVKAVDETVNLLESYGFKQISHTTALKFMMHLKKCADDIKKNIASSPILPSITE